MAIGLEGGISSSPYGVLRLCAGHGPKVVVGALDSFTEDFFFFFDIDAKGGFETNAETVNLEDDAFAAFFTILGKWPTAKESSEGGACGRSMTKS